MQNYYRAIQYLDSISNVAEQQYLEGTKNRSLYLKRFNYFLNLIGNPHLGFKYIHVGGTSGKGSVATMVHTILTKAGFNAGLYTSPYVSSPIEKIKVKNLLIDPNDFAHLLEEIKPAIDKAYVSSPYGRPSWFEIYTALAFLYFKKQKCDYVVLEVGLGGRYDATNIIKKPLITIINQIGIDHTDQLGNTITKIAQEKAAIIKPATWFFTPQTNSTLVLKIFKNACLEKKAKFNLVNAPEKPFKLQLLGSHQQINAALAFEACKKIGIKESAILAGLKETKIACRFELIQKKPTVILDGGHNMTKVKSTLKTLQNLTYKKLYLIIALTSDRNGVEIFNRLAKLADLLIVTRYQTTTRKAYPPKKLASRLNTDTKKEIYLDCHQALNRALKLADPNDLILVTGSFYLAGDLRKRWHSEAKILKERKI